MLASKKTEFYSWSAYKRLGYIINRRSTYFTLSFFSVILMVALIVGCLMACSYSELRSIVFSKFIYTIAIGVSALVALIFSLICYTKWRYIDFTYDLNDKFGGGHCVILKEDLFDFLEGKKDQVEIVWKVFINLSEKEQKKMRRDHPWIMDYKDIHDHFLEKENVPSAFDPNNRTQVRYLRN